MTVFTGPRSLSLSLSLQSAGSVRRAILHSCCVCVKLCHLDQTITSTLLFAWGGGWPDTLLERIASHWACHNLLEGKCECLRVWVCLCFILRTPDCCSFPAQRQNKHIKAKMCSSPAFTHITALFRTSGQPRIIIQLKQFSTSICQTDLIHHSNDTNGVSVFLCLLPQAKPFPVYHTTQQSHLQQRKTERAKRNSVVFVQQDVSE